MQLLLSQQRNLVLSMTQSYRSGVVAVVVTYQPILEVLDQLLNALVPQVTSVVLVDNGSQVDLETWKHERQTHAIKVLLLGENRGIAAAHNEGIQWARNLGTEFVLLMDQDSIPAHDMVVRLRSTYTELVEKGVLVAALGPRYRDSDNGTLSQFVRVGVLGFTLIDCSSENSDVEADFLISSGMLLPLTAIGIVGLMDEDLFIDHVDTEWCFRAKSNGFQLFGVGGAVMTHALGEQRKEIWFLRRRIVPFHNPFRYYYIFRNSILLYRRSYMPRNWKLADMIRCFKMAVFFGLVAPNRFACLKMMVLGSIDGFKGISGKRNEFL